MPDISFQQHVQVVSSLAPKQANFAVFLDTGEVVFYGKLSEQTPWFVTWQYLDGEPDWENSIHSSIAGVLANEPWVHIQPLNSEAAQNLDFHQRVTTRQELENVS